MTLPAPLSTMPGTALFANAAPEKKFTCINRSSTSNSVSRKEDREEMPPLLTSTSMTPEHRELSFSAPHGRASRRDSSANRSTEDLSPKSHATISTLMGGCAADASSPFSLEPSDRCSLVFAIRKHSRCTSSKAFSSLPLSIKRDGLHLVSRSASALPNPRDAPVSNIDLCRNDDAGSRSPVSVLEVAPISSVVVVVIVRDDVCQWMDDPREGAIDRRIGTCEVDRR
mmetsp:Transcript_17499/g.42064  ORF Transcript_17499/g.42064 Transcript_17499/m.42064 type:complete len:227 (+) Transcript_17499:681-1361(+)